MRFVAAAISRYGIDRRVVCAAFYGHTAGGDVAAGVFEPARALAARDSPASRDDLPGAEFCVRAVRAQNRGQGSGRTGSEFVAGGYEWRGARARGDDGPIREAFRAVRLSARGIDASVRAGRGYAGGIGAEAWHRIQSGPARARAIWISGARGAGR